MKKETYYQWVKASEELPDKIGWYLAKINCEYKTTFYSEFMRNFDNYHKVETVKWLKPITGYLLTEEEAREYEQIKSMYSKLWE